MRKPFELLEAGRSVLRQEGIAVLHAALRLGDEFVRAAEMIRCTKGRVIVCGVGKSGLIAEKVAKTFTSTGTPAYYLHTVDALHGDMGIIGRDDVAILISKSGESSELAGILDYLTRLGTGIIALTGDPASTLARTASVLLDCSVGAEACPHDLVPTTSSTVALAMGDALAIAVLEARGFTRADFARLHPAGSLGKRANEE
jgi:arabinose-5-phosphate isomerase